MPEFGLGSNTFNAIFGAIKSYDITKPRGWQWQQPWHWRRYVATGDGSDMGGSLPTQQLCNVVGRPSIGPRHLAVDMPVRSLVTTGLWQHP